MSAASSPASSALYTGHVKVFPEINNYKLHGPTVIKFGTEVGNNQ